MKHTNPDSEIKTVRTTINFYNKSSEPNRIHFYEADLDVDSGYQEIARRELGYVELTNPDTSKEESL
jgi:hypothetical protein